MANNERKQLVWAIKKGLFRLSEDGLFQIAIPRTPDQSSVKLDKHDEEGCIEYVYSYMDSTVVLELEDEGMSQLLFIKDMIAEMIHNCNQGDLPSRGGADVTVSDADVSSPLPSNVVHINTHATGTDPEIVTTALASQTNTLESQLSKLISSYDEWCQKLKQGSV